VKILREAGQEVPSFLEEWSQRTRPGALCVKAWQPRPTGSRALPENPGALAR